MYDIYFVDGRWLQIKSSNSASIARNGRWAEAYRLEDVYTAVAEEKGIAQCPPKLTLNHNFNYLIEVLYKYF